MTRLTQQKYDLTCALMKLGFEIHSGNEHLLFAAVDAYAVARESKASNKIAEIRRLCKAFLYDLPCSHNVAVIGDFLDAYADNKIIDEFKKTVVAAKDTEIAELKAQVEGLTTKCLDWKHESRELRAENRRLLNLHDDKDNEITGYKVEVFQLKSEIKRLRDALIWLKDNRSPDRAMIEVFIDKALSPAPVMETQNEDQHE
jgi:predicted nuclease with TOPRIM domain